MHKYILFTVIIPSYRSAGTVGDAVRSALTQEIEGLEVIVIDDGSPTDDAGAAERAGAGDPRLRVIKQANAGVSAARNAGIAAACGRYLAFLDADDMLLPGALAGHLEAFASDPGLALSFGRVRFWDPAHGEDGRLSSFCRTLTLPLILGDNQVCTASNICVRTDAARAIGGFTEDLDRAEDQDFLARLFLAAHKVRGIDRLTVNYRTSAEGLSSDLEQFSADWSCVVAAAKAMAPGHVANAEAEIIARFTRYAVRRRLRLGRPDEGDLGTLLRAVSQAPQLLVREPRRTLSTIAGVLAAPLLSNKHIARAVAR
ncbi:glycosyltransferase [Parvularcula sp. ZS-1/3]|uniref:Glycosyltransferase n=1 Tax=Parvularcula mediterranea TaxID=2732508 RepID=A0A7Y3W5H4_9PROT|nr:glycosyltransferase [Parvularcula mediterranea]NNU16508.1 glycosyltransferase [Parvularcula mediterranea]